MTTQHAPRLSALLLALMISSLAHLLVGLLLSIHTKPPPAPMMMGASKQRKVKLLSQSELKRIRRQRRDQRPRIPKEEEEPPPEVRSRQIVDLPPPEVERIPVKSELLSRYNSAVKREMVHHNRAIPQSQMIKSARRSLTTGLDKNGERRGSRRAIRASQPRQVKPKPPRSASPRKPDRREPKRSQTQRGEQGRAQRRASSERHEERQSDAHTKAQSARPKSAQRTLGEGPFKHDPSREQSGAPSDSRAREPQEAKGVDRGSNSSSRADRSRQLFGGLQPTHIQSLLPTLGPRDLERRDGSIDHLPHRERGDRTQLNTREYRYAFFFNRIKQAVAYQWKPGEVMRVEDPSGKRFGVKDRVTLLAVTLRPNGALVSVRVVKPSGAKPLDRIAVQAFKDAQPFHNPPPGLVDRDGLIRFRFGFYLEMGSRGLKLFR